MTTAENRKNHRSNHVLPVKGVDWLHNPVFNKGTAFSDAERDALGLRGLLPPHVQTMTDSMFIQAAHTLASLIRENELAEGRVYPSLNRIREVSLAIAVAVAGEVFAKNLNRIPRPADLAGYIRAQMFKPEYPDTAKPEWACRAETRREGLTRPALQSNRAGMMPVIFVRLI